ncbi:hypothetical protein GCM10022207_94300 [Streptomyces lannensis]|uniref:Uncharacterized protein n=1 Tax=Streptomyces lannensis TaxID=766498 RepID=A0ABP7LX26_9ACTN
MPREDAADVAEHTAGLGEAGEAPTLRRPGAVKVVAVGQFAPKPIQPALLDELYVSDGLTLEEAAGMEGEVHNAELRRKLHCIAVSLSEPSPHSVGLGGPKREGCTGSADRAPTTDHLGTLLTLPPLSSALVGR